VTTEDPTAPAQRPPLPEGTPAQALGRGGASRVLGASAPTEPLHVPTRRIVFVGTVIWAVALVVTLAVPSLHAGDRSWWPWTCVTGIALGAFAFWYVGRGGVDAADL
jgi:hypothetical protein